MAFDPFTPTLPFNPPDPGAGQGAGGRRLLATSSRAPTRERKLSSAHFAFMRAVVQGLDLRSSWERYLAVEGEATDTRLVRSTIAWIRTEFAAAARRQDRFGTARLVRLDASRIQDAQIDVPSLEEFAEEEGLEDFSQADQLEAFNAKYGSTEARLRRRGRFVARQLEALKWLEGLVAQPPAAGDAVASWLHPTLAARIEAANIFTLAQLVERVNGIGRRWHASIRGLGVAKAARITAWLRENELSLDLSVGRHVAVPHRKLYTHELAAIVPSATQIRPLEKFIVPAALDGRNGLYRRPQAQCLLKASNDYEAILSWLRSKQGLTPEQRARRKMRQRPTASDKPLDWLNDLSHTQRAYRKEAERFLLWAIMGQAKALSSMTTEDCTAYRDFLADPQPRSSWCGARSRPRWSPLWRPFEGPLSVSGQRQALTILKNLYGFLVDQNYLMGNPWSAVAMPTGAGVRINTGRSFSRAQWDFIRGQAAALEETSAHARLKLTLNLLYGTGMRLSEVVAATVDDLQWVEYGAGEGGSGDEETVEGWILNVVGKGNKLREVPVPDDVIGELSRYLMSRGLDPDPEHAGSRGAFLLGKASDVAQRAPNLGGWYVDPRAGIAAATLYDQLKAFFRDCAGVLRLQGDGKGAERFEKSSTHWLRHTHLSHAIGSGMPVQIAQQNAGHASLATTTVYVTTEQRRRMKAVGAFWRAAQQ